MNSRHIRKKHVRAFNCWSTTLAAVSLSLFATTALAAPVPGGSLDPKRIPKYVTALPIPGEMPATSVNSLTGAKNYDIELVQFRQQVLPPLDINRKALPPTTVWSYGATGVPATRSYPAFTVEATRNKTSNVTWRNNLVDAAGRPLPHLFMIDRSLHWANPEKLPCTNVGTVGAALTDCRPDPVANGVLLQQPYTGPVPTVTHVHGAHTSADSDGYAESWFLPANANCATLACTGAKANKLTDRSGTPTTNTFAGYANFNYANDQSSSTLWYHDHTLGITRLNVYAGTAGFWLLRERDNSETGLISGKLPSPAPKVGDAAGKTYFEIPLLIQDRSFNTDGSLFYPSNRAFFEGLTTLNVPFIGDPSRPSDIASAWNPETFFNVMVVNGKSWPSHNVEPQRYRFRVLNGGNSRFLNLSLQALDKRGKSLGEVPFYRIGSDQGLLPNVVRIVTGQQIALAGDGTEPPLPTTYPAAGTAPALLLAPSERGDVIVDFSALPAGTATVRMVNTAPDWPFGGFPDVPADPGTTGQVMQFVLIPNNTATFDRSSAPRFLRMAAMPVTVTTATSRPLSLSEEESSAVCVQYASTGAITYIDLNGAIFDPMDSANACVTAGGVPMAPKSGLLGTYDPVLGAAMPQMWEAPLTQHPALGATENWELNNFTVDAHPVHLHQVKFRVLDRAPIGGTPRAPDLSDSGWKDTVIAYPGEVTRVQAMFDIPGLFAWHCHILEHEDNEMMLPVCVGDPAGCAHPVAGGL